jgi:murein DD-endopeptidase MepM/ murein hydrolase activator NlpD
MALLFLASVGAIEAAPTTATDWTAQINATRASQLYYESLMRGADQQLRSLERARKQTQRKLSKGKAKLRRAKVRRSRMANRYRDTRQRFATAKRELVAMRTAAESIPGSADMVFPTAPDPAGAILVLSALSLAVADHQGAHPYALGTPDVSFRDAPDAPTDADVAASARDMVKVRKQMKKHKRAFKGASRKSRRVARNRRASARALSSFKRQRGAAIARREGAEAALAGRILAMSSLAQRRIAKKTRVRPGPSAGFTWPARGRLAQSYGCTGFRLNPARGSCSHFHDGIDIAGYRGSAVRSAAVGVVSYVGWNPWDQRRRAFIIVVAHPGGYESVYGHVLPSRRVRVGQVVRRGETIGYMGNTGMSTGVHLHFEMRRGNTTLNPLGFL